MKAFMSAVAIVFATAPALAGEWDYDDHCCVDTYVYERGVVYAPRDYPPRVVVPYGHVYAAEPEVYGGECTITRKYRPGYVRERIECDDD